MPYAALGDNLYNTFLLLHIFTAMVAFAPAFVHPMVTKQSAELDAANRGKILGFLAGNNRRIYAPALIVTGILGFGVAGMSKDPTGELTYKVSQSWLVAAVLVWVAMNGVLHGVISPAEKALAGGDASAQKRLDIGAGVTSILLVVMVYTMVFKPGF